MSMKKMKEVWYQDELWKVKEIVERNKASCFLILERVDEYCAGEDGEDVYLMAAVDTYNEEFYPNTPKVRSLLLKKKRNERAANDAERKLSEVWLENV